MKIHIDNASLSGSLGDKGLFRSANVLQIADVARLHACCSRHVYRQNISVKRVKFFADFSAILF